MKTITLVFVAIVFSCCAVRAKGLNENDSLLLILDKVIEQSDKYVDAKRKTIEAVMNRPDGKETTLADEYARYRKLSMLYRPYIYDSAMHYSLLTGELALKMGDRKLIDESKIFYSYILVTGGMYKEALENLGSINAAELPPELMPDYYLCYDQAYHHLSRYAADTFFEQEYEQKSREYIALLEGVTDDDSDHYFALSRVYSANPNIRIARVQLLDLLDRLEIGTHGHAIVASTLADCYSESGEERELRKKYLILSSISDKMSAVKEYVSLSNLAALLTAEGDVKRGYRYVAISMDDANFYNARLRRIEMSKIFPIIETEYKRELDRQNAQLRKNMLMISMLALLLFILVLYITRQTRELRKARAALLDINDTLVEANVSLTEANRIKEEYLARFLSMCSSYINRLDRYRSTIYHKLTTGKVEDVRIMTRSTEAIDYELGEFYRSFDKAFLRMYPNFREDFKALLKPEERIEPKDNWLMTTEMRIYALVRLGISDSASIARFLRYSANTVYTYRHKTKAKAINKETFDADILNIGV